jgi:RNA polymerase-binding transcription factor DksA
MVITTVRYSDEDLAMFKALIVDKLEKSRNEIVFLREQMREINENSSNQQSGDWTDESSSHTEMEMLNNMTARQQQFARNLENALVRIHNKTYGICSITGQLIDKNRLLLVPHATKTVEGKANRPTPNNAAHAASESKHRRQDEDSTATNEHDDAAISKEFFDNE